MCMNRVVGNRDENEMERDMLHVIEHARTNDVCD